MSANSLLRGQVEDIRSRNPQTTLVSWPATWAGAFFLYRPEVVGVAGVAEIQGASFGQPISKALPG